MGNTESIQVGGLSQLKLQAKILRRKLTPKVKDGSRETLWLYVMHIESFTLTPPSKELIKKSNLLNPKRPFIDNTIQLKDYYVPIAIIPVSNNDAITEFGTYPKFVPSGIFVCKILEYLTQCDPRLKRCSSNYAYVGDRYALIQDTLKGPGVSESPPPAAELNEPAAVSRDFAAKLEAAKVKFEALRSKTSAFEAKVSEKTRIKAKKKNITEADIGELYIRSFKPDSETVKKQNKARAARLAKFRAARTAALKPQAELDEELDSIRADLDDAEKAVMEFRNTLTELKRLVQTQNEEDKEWVMTTEKALELEFDYLSQVEKNYATVNGEEPKGGRRRRRKTPRRRKLRTSTFRRNRKH